MSTTNKVFEDSMVMVVVMMVMRVEHIWIHMIASCSSRIEQDEVSAARCLHSSVHVHDLIFVHSLV